MSTDTLVFLLKVLLLSLGISLLIRYGGPLLPIQPSTAIALTAVISPSVILGGLLLWRGTQAKT
jgi:hypothetical protein